MRKNVIKAVFLTAGLFIYSLAQAYTMQDYNEADEAVVLAQNNWYQAISEASWSNFQPQVTQAAAENRAGIMRCGQLTDSFQRQDCVDQVNDEYNRVVSDLDQQWMDAQMAMAKAEIEFHSAQSHLDEVRSDLIAQGLLQP